MNPESDIDKTCFTGEIDWSTAVACVAIGFLSGVLANYWWAKRRAAREDGDGQPRIAMTFPFL